MQAKEGVISSASPKSRYQLKELLGEGGMGKVYLAEDLERSQKVALKFLPPHFNSTTYRLFREEVELLSHLSHVHLIKIFDFYDAEPAQAGLPELPFYSMEYAAGQMLQNLPKDEPVSRWVDLMAQFCQGLHYLHVRRIFHRDLKPSNVILTPAGDIKILDFGLAGILKNETPGTEPLGTLAYMAPEAFWGDYDAQSDLFSLGVLFYEILTGQLPFEKPLSSLRIKGEAPSLKKQRPDLPDFFTDLVDRMLELKDTERPSSALSILKYLNQHVDTPYKIVEEDISETILQKAPFTGREREADFFWEKAEEAPTASRATLIRVHGPTGVGRSRFLEEMKWKLQLNGFSYSAFPSGTSASWLSILADRFGLNPTEEEKKDPLPQARLYFLRAKNAHGALAFTDLQDWSEKSLRELQLFLSLAKRSKSPGLFLLEYNQDRLSPPLEALLSSISEEENSFALELEDLSPGATRELIRNATVDQPLPESFCEEIVLNSGGRPLLILEALRRGMTEREQSASVVPTSFRDLCALQVKSLQGPSQKLLSFLAVHSGPVSTELAKEGCLETPETFQKSVLELENKNLIRPAHLSLSELRLAHPSLKSAFLEALPHPLLSEAHRNWTRLLLKKWGHEPQAIPASTSVAEHSWGGGEFEIFKKWAWKAAEFSSAQGHDLEALSWYEKLFPHLSTAMEKIYLFAFEAPLFYRLGRFDEAIRAYDLWFQEIDPTPHNLTLVQTVKYHLYTGLVNFTAGRETASRERLEECLKTGDHDQHPRLRLYHVRAHSLLAALDEKEEKLESARSHLEAALALATEDPLLKSEIEQRLGALDQLTLRYEEAMAHFENALALSREAKSPQAQAIAHHSIALLHRECGKPLKALEVMEEALQWAQKGSDLLQQSRYCENKALIEMDLGRYAKAFSIMEEVQDILEQYGEDRDHFLMKIHRATLALFTGNWDRAEKIIAQAEKDPASRKESLSPSLLLLKAERSYLALRYAETAPLFRKLLRELKPGAMNFDFLTAQIGLLRCLSRSGKLEKSEWIHAALLCRMETLQDTAFSIWRKTFSLLSLPPEESLREADFLDLLQSIQKVELPEMRIDLYGLVSLDLKRRNLTALAERLWQACRQELENLHQLLPEELKMDFEKNRDLKSLDQTLNDLLPTSKEEIPPSKQTEAPGARPASQGRISEIRFRQYSEINRQISQKTDLNEILERVMDAAIEITGAERGFLLLKNGTGKNSLSDFQVKTARHFNHRSLEENEFQFSMSAVEEAVKQGTYLLTDNAQYDPRLQEKKSVVKFSLKSILVVPLELEGEVLGAIYLDHRYQPDCFSEEDVVLLTAFASQGALAIQKAQMMEELRAAKAKLEEQVENQAQRIEVLSTELSQVRDQLRYGYEEIVGQSPGMMKVFQLLDHVTETTIPVWILGESGTGKELIARSLHFNSPRDKGPFVTENVSAIPETLLESELFGHKKGAFTHADRDRVGLFEQAHNGTLFLDEIADMSLAMQAKLLRVLQEGEIRPLGSSKKIKVDVRLVTASNRDLNQMVKDEKFRQDLFFRINGLTIKLPALRERKDDIPLLVDYLVKKIAKGFNLQPSEVSDEALQIFLRYEWPGNIRELEGTLRNALLFAKGRPITKEVLSTQENLFKTGQSMGRESSRKIEGVSAEENSSERQIILDALRRHNMDKEAVAEELDISLRNLYTRMERHNIPKKKTVLSKYLGLK